MPVTISIYRMRCVLPAAVKEAAAIMVTTSVALLTLKMAHLIA